MKSMEGKKASEHMFSLFESCMQETRDVELTYDDAGKILAPNGLVSELQDELLCKVVRTQKFKAWFGDWENDPEHASMAVYKSTGEPLLVFHGTPKDIPLHEGLSPEKLDKAVYFIDDKKHSLAWGGTRKRTANETAVVYPCFLNVREFHNDKRPHIPNYRGGFTYAVTEDTQVMHTPYNSVE